MLLANGVANFFVSMYRRGLGMYKKEAMFRGSGNSVMSHTHLTHTSPLTPNFHLGGYPVSGRILTMPFAYLFRTILAAFSGNYAQITVDRIITSFQFQLQ